jgi:MFS family permease
MMNFFRNTSFAIALRHRNYRLYATGNALSLIGTWMQRLAVGWLAWELSGSPLWLGLIAFADLFPTVLLAPFAGALADSRDRLAIMRTTQALAMAQALVLFATVATGVINVHLLFALSLWLGIVNSFDQPARLSLIAALLPRDDLAHAVALNSVTFNTARFIGPAIAGFLLAVSGAAVVFALNALSFVLFLVILFQLRVTGPAVPRATDGSFLSRLAGGIHIFIADKGLRTILVLLVCLTIGVRPVNEMLPGFASQVFDVGPTGLAALTAAMGIGSVLGGLSIGATSLSKRLSRMLLLNTFTLGLGVLAFIATTVFWVALPALVLVGFSMSRTAISAQTALHLSVDESLRGRVLSLYGMIFRGGPALGALLVGLASQALGLRWPILAGVVCLAGGWIWAFSRRNTIAASLEGRQA